MKKTSIITVVLLLIFSHGKSQKGKKLSALQDSLTQSLIQANQGDQLVGFSVSILKKKQKLYSQGFGFADEKAKRKYASNSIQNIGSVAKTFLGIAVLKAQELGKLQLDDPINDYLPFEVVNPHHPESPIRIRHLTSHSSSILDEENNYLKAFILENDSIDKANEVAFSHFQKPDKRISLKEYLEACLSKEGKWYTPQMFSKEKPGSSFEYTNFGADLLGLIIEEATDMPYKDFCSKYIFDPLGMENTAFTIAELDAAKRSNFYLFKGQQIADYTAITYPNGGIFTSADDLSKFLVELMRAYKGKGRLLSKESYRQYFQKQYEEPLNESGRINLGCFIEYNNDFIGSTDLLIGHNGSDFGSFALMYFDPEKDIGMIMMCNTDIDYKDDIIVPRVKAVWNAMLEFKSKLD